MERFVLRVVVPVVVLAGFGLPVRADVAPTPWPPPPPAPPLLPETADAPPPVVSTPVKTVGWLEAVVFPDVGLRLVAKFDTGAKTSALDAEDIEPFERDGETWVRFKLRQKKGSTDVRPMEGRVVHEKGVRTAMGAQRRPTVALWVCVAGERRRVLFTLGSREAMNYRVILGRRAMEGRLAIDPARKFTTEPGCPSKAAP